MANTFRKPGTKDAVVRSRVSPQLKADFKSTVERLGLSESEAITVFMSQVVLQQGLPFEVKIPNVETQEALDEDAGTCRRYKNVAAMRADILNEDE